jgi:class 3 adenylate cyclase/tetratricopeptide (TPR) repeat protein
VEASEHTVECPACGSENREGSRFCGECGSSLASETACPSCGSANPAGQRFCNQCGAELAAPRQTAPPVAKGAPPAPDAPAAIAAPDHLARKARAAAAELAGERKQVTVLFADVMGSMELAERTDPERWQTIMDGFFRALAEAVHRFEGTVDKFTGDGIMALFGAPIAHEDHARRACYAALEMQRAVGEYAAEVRRSDGISLTTRIGINSGEVVVGSIGDDLSLSYTAVGHTVGLAQRMESLAEPGKAYLTANTERMAAGFLELSDLGDFEVKGASEPLRVHELVGVGSARGRLDVAQERGFSRFVGRGAEMTELEAALEQASAGEGRAVGIVAEAGIGKSRLCHEFAERCRARGTEVYEAQCQSHGEAIPLLPVLQMLRGYFGIGSADSEREAREKIAGRLLLIDPDFGDDLGLVFDFLAVPDPERPAPSMNPEARQRRLLDFVRRIAQAAGRQGPVVNLIEDLHWIDPASEAFLKALVEAVPGTSSLVVTNFRPEYRAEWMGRSHYHQLPLAPLTAEALQELLVDLLGADPSLDGLSELIREQTGGNPFYVEEAVRELAESGALEGSRGAYRLVHEIGELQVPPTVQAILAARIDRLDAAAKQTLQAAATIGKEFERRLLALAVPLEPDELDAALDELVAAEFIHETALYPEPEYAFRHPLTQEVAYGSQLAATRAATHAAIARGLQEIDSELLDERAALIAQHFEQAGEAMDAATWHARAAGWAGFADPRAALGHWQRIRELDSDLPEGAEADAMRAGARVMILGVAWRLGLDIAESRKIFEEGRALAERSGDAATLAMLHGTLGVSEATCGGNVPEYVRLQEEMLRIAEEIEEPNMQVAAATGPMYGLYLAGRQEESLATLDRVLELTAEDPQLGAGIIVANPHAWATSFRTPPLMTLGRMEEARCAAAEGAELCRRWDRESLGWTYGFMVGMTAQGSDPAGPETVAHARQAVEVAEQLGDAFSRINALHWLGVALLLTGDPAEANRLLESCIGSVESRGAGREWEPGIRGHHADALLALGEVERALEEAETAVRLSDERGVVVLASTVRNTLAEVLIARDRPGDLDRAAAALDQAAQITRDTHQVPDVIRTGITQARLAAARGDGAVREAALAEAESLAAEIDAKGFLAEIEAERERSPVDAA